MASAVAALIHYLTDELLESPATLPDHMSALLEVLQSQHIFSSPHMTLDLHKQWSQKLMTAVKHKQTPVRCCGLALLETTLLSSHPLGNDPELINAWTMELPDIFRRAISPVELEAAAASMHAVTTAALRNAESRRDLLTVHLPKIMAALQLRLDGDAARVQYTVVEHVAQLLRAIRASARPYIVKLEIVARRLLLHSDLSVRNAAVSVLVSSTLCTADDTWSPLAALAILSLELQLDALSVAEEEDDAKLLDKKNRRQQAGAALFGEEPTTDTRELLGRCETCVRLLRALLDGADVGAVNFPLRDALRIVGRVLNWRVSASDGSDVFAQATTIPRAQSIVIRLLKALVRRVSGHLYRDAEVLFMLLLRLLGNAAEIGAPSYLTMAVLSAMRAFLSGFGLASAQFVSPLANILREQLLPARTEAPPSGGAAAQRKRKKKATAQEVATSAAQRAQEAEKLYSHMDLMIARLSSTYLERNAVSQANITGIALQHLLLHAGSALTRKHRLELDQLLLSLLCHMETEHALLPYALPSFRLTLYSALHASLLSPLDTQSPLLPYATHFFAAGQRDPIRQVAEFCVQGAAVCAARLNSRPASDAYSLSPSSVQAGTAATPAQAPSTLFTSVASAPPPPPPPPGIQPTLAEPMQIAAEPISVAASPPASFIAPPQLSLPASAAASSSSSAFQLPVRDDASDADGDALPEIVDRSPDDSSAE